MDTTIKTQQQKATVKQFDCQGCGNSLATLHPRAKYLACPYCGSVLDVRSEEHEILQALGNPEKHEPFSFIRLGMMAQFDGREYQAISRTRWRMRYKEYWNEEGESGYSNEIWVFDEWLLMDANRTYFYLIEDKEGFKRSEEIIPETPSLLTPDLRMSFFQQQPRQIVREYGGAEAIHFEGESNYQIRKGDEIRFALFKERGIDYSVEWRIDPDAKEIKEVEFFREVPISRRKVLEAFGNNEEVEKIQQSSDNWRFISKVALFAGLAMLFMSFRACTSSGEMVHDSLIELSQVGEAGVISAPIELPGKGLYAMEIEAVTFVENSELYYFAYILDSEQKAVNKVDGNFYWWTGYDDEGKWTEKDLDARKRFKLDAGGTYYLQSFVESELTPAGSLRLRVYKGVMLTRYFFFAMIICFVVWGVSRARASV